MSDINYNYALMSAENLIMSHLMDDIHEYVDIITNELNTFETFINSARCIETSPQVELFCALYAFNAQLESGEDICESSLESHLHLLEDNKVYFDFDLALDLAKSRIVALQFVDFDSENNMYRV